MPTRIQEIEAQLGPRKSYIITAGDIPLLREYARLIGIHPFDARKLSGVELANLYHAGEDAPTSETDLNSAIVKVLHALNLPTFNLDVAARIAREQIKDEILNGETTRKLIEELAPRRIEIQHAASTVTLPAGTLHYMTEKVIRIAALGDNIMLVGPAGCGKTRIGEDVARALLLPFYITSTINDTHELTGFIDGYGKYHSTPFRQAFEFGGLWVADEIDAWDAAALLAANSALANGYATFPDRDAPITRHDTFRVIATANTFGNGADRIYIGRNELDAASLDRFATINVGYDLNLERMFSLGNKKWLDRVWEIRKKVEEKKIRHVVSSRAIIRGSKALAAGIGWGDVEEFYLLKGMSKTDREKVI